MIALTFALPDESREFIAAMEGRFVQSRGRVLPVVSGHWQDVLCMVIHTGVGNVASYRERLASLLATERPELLISTGYAGGLLPGVAVGELVLGENMSDPHLVRQAREILKDHGVIYQGVSVTRLATAETAEAKAALHEETGALAVDMETAWIADVCAAAGVPMLSVRVISDAAEQAFPVPGHILFDARRQRPRYLALPVWLLLHPGSIGPFIRFVRGVGMARGVLTSALRSLVTGLQTTVS